MRSKIGDEQHQTQDRSAGAGKAAANRAIARPRPEGAARVKHGLY